MMKIGGFSKLTLLDFPGCVACIVFTSGCNFRCPFCHNASLVTHTKDSEDISEDEILSYLKKRKGLLDGVVITGGEPLLQNGIEDFIIKVRDLGYKVKLDTNGSFPDKLKNLLDKGLLDYVAMDIKNSKEKYSATAGCEVNLADIEKSISHLENSGVGYELRTTVTQELHNQEDIKNIALWIKKSPKYFIQNFKNSGDIVGENLSEFSKDDLEKLLKTACDNGLSAFVR